MYENVSIPIVLSVFIALYVTFIYFSVRLMRSKREEGKKKFFKALFEGLKLSSITTLENVINIYKGATGLSSEDLQYRFGLSRHLREFLVELTSKNKSIFGETLDEKKILPWIQKINEVIKKNEEISPFADLPAAERNILTDLLIYAENNDIESTNRKLSELAGLIQGRNDALIKTSKINKWAIPISAIGIVLTIIFGILATT